MQLADPPAPPVMDPRIRARRIEVRRGAGRRRLQRLVDAGCILVVALGFLGALYTPLLDVDAVRVLGTEHLGEKAVRSAAGIDRGEPLISVDMRSAGERVAALPWVREVVVDRGVDGTITLEVTERNAVAVVAGSSGSVVVDIDGRVLGSSTEATGGLPTLAGIEGAPDPGEFLADAPLDALELAARLAESLPPAAITGIDPKGLVAHLAQGGSVRFGDARQLDAKLRSLRTMLAQVDLTCLGTIDVRLPSSAVLTRAEACS